MSEHLSDDCWQRVDGKKEGYWITYYANGNKKREGAYKNGQKEGKWILYHQNGNKQSEATFRNGLYEGHYANFYCLGILFNCLKNCATI